MPITFYIQTMIAIGLYLHHSKNRPLHGTLRKDTIVSENIQLDFYGRGIAHNGSLSKNPHLFR